MQRSNPPILNAPDILKWLAGALVVIHAVRYILPQAYDDALVLTFAFDASVYGQNSPYAILTMIVGPVTYIFLHGSGIMHVGVNSTMLLAFGSPTARRMGAAWFAAFFLLSGVAGAAAWFIVNPFSAVPVVGASGSISGLMGGYVRLGMQKRPARGGPMSARDQQLVMPFAVAWIGLNVFFLLVNPGLMGSGGEVAWEAHLGGFAFGALAINLFDGRGQGGRGGGRRTARFKVIDGDMD